VPDLPRQPTGRADLDRLTSGEAAAQGVDDLALALPAADGRAVLFEHQEVFIVRPASAVWMRAATTLSASWLSSAVVRANSPSCREHR